MRWSRLLILLLMPMFVFAQTPIHFGDGGVFGAISRKTRLPIIVIDTVAITAGFGTFKLNKRIKSQIKNVIPTAKQTLYATITPILRDTSKIVYSYGYTINDAADTLMVKSSGGTADTGCVVIQIFMR